MGALAEKLDNMVAAANSPDQKISAKVSQRSKITLKFSPGSYETYSQGSLEHQLARLAELTWIKWQRGYEEALHSRNMRVMKPELAKDEATRKFLENRLDIESFGESDDGFVRVKTRGLRQWKVKIKPDILPELDEETFSRSCMKAVATVIADYNQKNEAYKKELYL
ncbi:MAG TPA: hypothetical protein H9902_13735 [Candidatus Stackebrandtia faecavium]|nr:hypothetical protein [Candidatus Stackebrandtia faecavium]